MTSTADLARSASELSREATTASSLSRDLSAQLSRVSAAADALATSSALAAATESPPDTSAGRGSVFVKLFSWAVGGSTT